MNVLQLPNLKDTYQFMTLMNRGMQIKLSTIGKHDILEFNSVSEIHSFDKNIYGLNDYN